MMKSCFGFIPPILPDEHYLGFIARVRVIYLSCLAEKNIKRLLFDNSSLSKARLYQPYIFNALDAFEHEYEHTLRKHTLQGFYSHSLRANVRSRLLKNKLSYKDQEPFVPHLTKHANNFNWKKCSLCIQNDLDTYGVSYWHVAHQLPTSSSCHIHNGIKLESSCSTCGCEVTDLREEPVPKINCSNCGKSNDIKFSTNTVSNWIQNFGLTLHFESGSLLNPNFEFLMTRAVALETGYLIGNRGLSSWRIISELQAEFETFVFNNNLLKYFDGEAFGDISYLLSLEKILKRPRSVTPLAHILWTIFIQQRNGSKVDDIHDLASKYIPERVSDHYGIISPHSCQI